jgi:hypothetical protein
VTSNDPRSVARTGTPQAPSARAAAEPETEIVIGSREQLFHLLAEASEIEHTLMCSYLYAAFSLKTGEQSGLSSSESPIVRRWRKEILAVATEEMTHLLLVANLSIALGGRPHFGRPNFPVASGYFPSGVVVKLTPFSRETLEHFIFLERPRGVHRADGEGFEAENDYEREEAHHGLMPSVQDYTTIGRLYDAIRSNLVASARRVGARGLLVGPVDAQIGPDILTLDGVTTIDSMEAALAAIETIVEQGEGSRTGRQDSHYERFLKIQREYDELTASNPGFEPAWPAAESPVMRRPPEPEDKVFIDDPRSAPVLDLANAIYSLLLRFLLQAFGRPDESGSSRRRYMDGAIGLMHVLAQISSALATLPASSAYPGVNAGMTFTMLRSVEPFFVGAVERTLVNERLAELTAGARRLAELSTPGLDGLERKLREVAAECRG